MDRIKRLSYEVLENHHSKFGEDFADNKKILDQITIIRSKGLKNEVAGYITKHIKRQIRDEKVKQAQRKASQTESVQEPTQTESVQEPTQTESVQEPTQTESVQEPTQTESVQEPTQTESVQEPTPVDENLVIEDSSQQSSTEKPPE